MAEAAFKLLSLSSWYIRSLSASGNCKKFCIARRFTSRDWDAVLGSSSFRRISESNPCRGRKTQGELAPCSGQGMGSVLFPAFFMRCRNWAEASSLYRNILATAEVVEKRASIVSLILLSICFTYSRNWNGLIGLLPLSSLTCREIFPREMVGEVKNKWTLYSTTVLSCAVLKLRQRHRATDSRHSTFSRAASQTYEEGAAAQHSRPLRLLFIKTIFCYSLMFK